MVTVINIDIRDICDEPGLDGHLESTYRIPCIERHRPHWRGSGKRTAQRRYHCASVVEVRMTVQIWRSADNLAPQPLPISNAQHAGVIVEVTIVVGAREVLRLEKRVRPPSIMACCIGSDRRQSGGEVDVEPCIDPRKVR